MTAAPLGKPEPYGVGLEERPSRNIVLIIRMSSLSSSRPLLEL